MRFEWDENKNRINLSKHCIDFELAKEVFFDPLHKTLFDQHINSEDRWNTIGKIGNNYILIVVTHTDKDINGEEIVRIISARKATKHERFFYENN